MCFILFNVISWFRFLGHILSSSLSYSMTFSVLNNFASEFSFFLGSSDKDSCSSFLLFFSFLHWLRLHDKVTFGLLLELRGVYIWVNLLRLSHTTCTFASNFISILHILPLLLLFNILLVLVLTPLSPPWGHPHILTYCQSHSVGQIPFEAHDCFHLLCLCGHYIHTNIHLLLTFPEEAFQRQ